MPILKNKETGQLGLSINSACEIRRPKDAHTEKAKAMEEWKAKSKILGKLVIKVDDQIIALQQDGYGALLSSVSRFVSEKSDKTHGYLPMAVVKLGVNMSDNEVLFDLLKARLRKDKVASSIVKMSNSDLSSLSTVISKLASELIKGDVKESIFGDAKPKRNWYQPYAYSSLLDLWKKHTSDTRPLVILVKELDKVDFNSGLKNLILSAQLHLKTHPVVLICGSYSNAISLQNILPSRVTDCLYVENFSLLPSRELFERVLNNVLISSEIFAFKIGPRVIEAIIDNFVRHDFSLQGLNTVIHACLFNHFYKGDLVAKLGFKNDYRIVTELSKLSKQELDSIYENIKDLNSVKGVNVKQTRRDSSAFKTFLSESLANLKACHDRFIVSLHYLYLLTSELPEKPFGTSFSSFYALALEKELVKTAECDSALTSLRFLAADELRERFDACLRCIENEESPFRALIDKHLTLLDELESDCNEVSSKPQARPQVDMSRVKSRSEWQSTLKATIVPRQLTKYEVWRNCFLDDLKNQISVVVSPMTLPLHEVIYCDDVDYIYARCFPSQRDSTVETLRNPLEQLEGIVELKEHCQLDISALFDLYTESSASINIRDLLDAFLAHVETSKTSPTKRLKKKGKGSDNEKDRRFTLFFNAIEDFEYVGFVQKNKRKADHLTKLVWE
ncbi:Origin recognition complex subunit 3 [Halotydeus destructor]|nr:Origin recognition complex subunit 3 [Halotydeus destructor]